MSSDSEHEVSIRRRRDGDEPWRFYAVCSACGELELASSSEPVVTFEAWKHAVAAREPAQLTLEL